MKKFAICTLVLSLLTFCLFGCSSEPKHFSGEWKFAEISKVELIPNPYSSEIEALKQIYGAQDEAGIIAGAFNAFVADQTFNSCNIRFEKDRVYTYDPLLEREATWVFYQTGDNVGFLSFFTELDADEGNPEIGRAHV